MPLHALRPPSYAGRKEFHLPGFQVQCACTFTQGHERLRYTGILHGRIYMDIRNLCHPPTDVRRGSPRHHHSHQRHVCLPRPTQTLPGFAHDTLGPCCSLLSRLKSQFRHTASNVSTCRDCFSAVALRRAADLASLPFLPADHIYNPLSPTAASRACSSAGEAHLRLVVSLFAFAPAAQNGRRPPTNRAPALQGPPGSDRVCDRPLPGRQTRPPFQKTRGVVEPR